jgi:hypothetical protein
LNDLADLLDHSGSVFQGEPFDIGRTFDHSGSVFQGEPFDIGRTSDEQSATAKVRGAWVVCTGVKGPHAATANSVSLPGCAKRQNDEPQLRRKQYNQRCRLHLP